SSELSSDRFLLEVLAFAFGLGVGFLILSFVVIDDCIDVAFVVVVGFAVLSADVVVVVGFAVVAADVVAGLLICFFGLMVVVLGCFLSFALEG
ncbi:unnamed protein product, partial [Rotaria magnacalcarata]